MPLGMINVNCVAHLLRDEHRHKIQLAHALMSSNCAGVNLLAFGGIYMYMAALILILVLAKCLRPKADLK